MKKKRLIVCSGYYSIVNTITVLKQRDTTSVEDFENILLVFVNHQDKEKINNLISLLYNFDKIYLVGKVNANWELFGEDNFNFLVESYWDEIYISYYLFEGKWIINKLNNNYSSIIMVDEGCQSYTDIFNRTKNTKVQTAYLFNPDLVHNLNNINWIKFHYINPDIYSSVLSLIKENLILKENSVIVLSVHSWHNFDSSKAYNDEDIKIINNILSKGYNVYFKVHPRNYLKEIQSLIATINSDRFFIIDASENLIIDTILLKNKDKIKFMVGEDSSILYQSHRLFNIPSFSTLPEEDFNGRYIHKIRMLKFLPSLNEFLQSNLTPEEFYIKAMDNLNSVRDRFDIFHTLLLSREEAIINKDTIINEKNNIISNQENIINNQSNDNHSDYIAILENKIKKQKSWKRKLNRVIAFLTVLSIGLLVLFIF
ncbi:MAG: alpha-2,8-polysialyltransferase family protein [Alphaproteobacteria bacterium]|jgi:hypothetical protein|nr:alpha-2,8-polysialyltransferase family protein [Alphaproteobacteria bacterium]